MAWKESDPIPFSLEYMEGETATQCHTADVRACDIEGELSLSKEPQGIVTKRK